MKFLALVTFCLLSWSESFLLLGWAQDCGEQAGGAVCPGGGCCSRFGWCGDTKEHCGKGCQSQCEGPGKWGVSDIVPAETYHLIYPHPRTDRCPGGGFYTYDAFIKAASNFSGFGTTGDIVDRKREIAAFLAQTGKATAFDCFREQRDPYSWGYCYVSNPEQEEEGLQFCTYDCADDKRYFGRGPIQLTWNFNYDACGKGLGVDLVNDPDLLSKDPVISFQSAILFWMTSHSEGEPSCHDVMVGNWKPSGSDIAHGRQPGYGLTTNIISGGKECGSGPNTNGQDRIGFYERICAILGVNPGADLDCYKQEPFLANRNNHVQSI